MNPKGPNQLMSSFKREELKKEMTIIFRLLVLVLCLQDNLLLHYIADHVSDYN